VIYLESSLKGKIIVGGTARGMILFTKQPINFLSSVDHMTGRITDKNHELWGRFLKDSILIFPYSVGSSASGCAIANIPLLELCKDQVIPEIENPSEGLMDANSGYLQIKKV
jgi:predicted aconitase with swiveling domain